MRDLRCHPHKMEAPSFCSIAAAIGGIAVSAGTVGATAAGVGAIGAVGSSLISANAAQSAANTQASAEENAQQIQLQMYDQNAANLAPYNSTGQQANAAISQMPAFSFAPTEANLENTPGYQFNLYQGEKATQNAAAARGLASSGAALKGAATYASGLANTTYQNQFQNALNSYQTNLGKLQGQANLGESAAAQTGNMGTTAAGNIGSAAVGAANAQAAGTVGTANAISGGLSGLSNSFLTGAFLSNQSGGLFGGGQNQGLVNSYDNLAANSFLPASTSLPAYSTDPTVQ